VPGPTTTPKVKITC